MKMWNRKSIFDVGLLYLLVLFYANPCCAEVEPFQRADDLRPKSYLQWEKNRKAVWIDLKGSGAVMNGNVSQFTVGGALDTAFRLTDVSRFYLQASAGYTSFNNIVLFDKEKGSATYVHQFDSHWGWFAGTTQLRNRFLHIDYRASLRGGIGYENLFPDVFALSGLAVGLAPEHTAYSGAVINNDLRGQARLNLGIAVLQNTTLEADVVYLPLFRDFSSFRLYCIVTARFKIVPDLLSFEFSVSDEYDSRPRPTVLTNDFSLTYSLVIHFDKDATKNPGSAAGTSRNREETPKYLVTTKLPDFAG